MSQKEQIATEQQALAAALTQSAQSQQLGQIAAQSFVAAYELLSQKPA